MSALLLWATNRTEQMQPFSANMTRVWTQVELFWRRASNKKNMGTGAVLAVLVVLAVVRLPPPPPPPPLPSLPLLACHYNYIHLQFMYHLMVFRALECSAAKSRAQVLWSETHLHSIAHCLLMRFTCVSLNGVHGIEIIRWLPALLVTWMRQSSRGQT